MNSHLLVPETLLPQSSPGGPSPGPTTRPVGHDPHIKRPRAPLGGLALCVVLAVAACSSSDDETNAEDTEGGAITSSSPAESTSDAGDSSTHVEDATTFWEAVAAGDRDLASSLLDPAVLDTGRQVLFGRAATFDGQFDWYESVDWTWTFEECVTDGDSRVQCTATASNPWSDALGECPVNGTFGIQFGDDGIRSMSDATFRGQWVPTVFRAFEGWVRENHPEDAEVMFDFGVDVDEQILGLYEANTERFAEAHQETS